MAEYVEVAHRVGGVAAAAELAEERSGKQFDPALAALMHAEAEVTLAGLDSVRTWDAAIDAEPALAVVSCAPTPAPAASTARSWRRCSARPGIGSCGGARGRRG
jgi:hypothetical protein